MPTSGLVGQFTYSDGTTVANDRFGRQGDKIVTELNGRYYEQVSRGNTFIACSQAVATTTVGLATTYTGLCLSNPIASGKNLVLLYASMNQSVIQATQVEAFLLATGSSPTTNVTHTAAATIQSAMVGSNLVAAVGKADTSATLPVAPLYSLPLTNTATATQNAPGDCIELAGSIVLAPGAYAAFVTPAQASVAGMWFSFTWAEVPV